MPVHGQPVRPRGGDSGPHAVDLAELLQRGGGQGLHAAKTRRQGAGRRRAHVAHGQGHQDPPQGAGAGGDELVEHTGGVLAGSRGPLDRPGRVVGLLGPEEAGQAPVPCGLTLTGHLTPHHDVAQVLHRQVEQPGLPGQDRGLGPHPARLQQPLSRLHAGRGVQGPELLGGDPDPGALGLQDPPGRQGRQGLGAPGVGLGQGGGGLVPQALDVQGAA